MLIFDDIIKNLSSVGSVSTIIDTLNSVGRSPLDIFEENEPQPLDSIGCLISKLSCATVQMFNNQDILYKIRTMTAFDFTKEYSGHHLDELHKIIKRACDLNVQRTRLMDAIDRKSLELRIDDKHNW